MHEVIMPKLGLTMETGVIEKWHKKEGDKVEAGEVLFEVMTDKVSLEVEAYHSGILKKILKKEGEEVPVTEVIAFIGEEDEEVPEGIDKAASAKVEESGQIQKQMASQAAAGGSSVLTESRVSAEQVLAKQVSTEPYDQKLEQLSSAQDIRSRDIKISPLARNLALAKGVDITRVKGSGPGGRIVKEDIESYLASISTKETQEQIIESEGRIKISPLARKTAAELGIDYKTESIKGTGPEGRIVKDDILAYAEAKKKAAQQQLKVVQPEFEKETQKPVSEPSIIKPILSVGEIMPVSPAVKSSTPLKGMRKVIAERLTYSKQNIPHIILTEVIDATELVLLRERTKDKVQEVYGAKLTYTDFIIKASAIVLAEQPVINASLQDGNHIIYDDVNIGVAVSVKEGLIVPTIYKADRLRLSDIAKKRTELVDKAHRSVLTIEEISNGTFTITNLGMYGIRNFTAIINPPQGAILMVGEIYKAPVVIDDKIVIRSLMDTSIAVDHRIIDGADAAKFLARLKDILENPEIMLI